MSIAFHFMSLATIEYIYMYIHVRTVEKSIYETQKGALSYSKNRKLHVVEFMQLS